MGGKESPILGETASLPPVFLRTQNGEISGNVRVEKFTRICADPKSKMEDKRHNKVMLSKDNRERRDSKDTTASFNTMGRCPPLQFLAEGAQGVEW